jgi:DegV family protein with EDD domain
MSAVAVVTDSTVCLPAHLVQEYGINVVPLRFELEGKSYRDGIDITADDIYRHLASARTLPTTSAPSPSDYYAAIAHAAAIHTEVLVITISHKFSAMLQSAMTAAATARDSLGHVRTHVLDSGTAAGAQGLVVLEAARAAAAGRPLNEVIDVARETMCRVELVAFLDTLYYLAKGGRVPMALHWANAVIRVNPVFRIQAMSGEAKTVCLARGRHSARRHLLELVDTNARSGRVHGIVFHSYCHAEAERLSELLCSTFDCAELHISDFTPAMGIHTGTGVLGLSYLV